VVTFLQSATKRTMLAAALLGVAVATSFALTTTSPTLVSGALATMLVIGLILRRPELGALLVIVLVSIVPRSVLFDRGLPFGGGSLKVTDLLLILTLGSWLAGRATRPARFPLPSRSVTALLLGVLGSAIVGVVTAHVMGSSLKLSLLELRPLLSYLLVFPLVSGALSWRRFERGLTVVFVAAGVSACVAIVQYVNGNGGSASFTGGALRVQSSVYLAPLIALVWVPVVIAYARSTRIRAAALVLAVLALGGVYFTFARGAWVALLVAAPMVIVLLPPRRRGRALRWLVAILAVAVCAVLAFHAASAHGVANPLTAGLKRFQSVGAFRGDESSRYRFAEWSEARRQIERHPLTGIGLGNSITFTNPMYSSEYNTYGYTFSTFYIHNSYIWLALKLGLVGALIFLSLLARICWLAYHGYREAFHPGARMALLATLGSLFAILVLSTTGPHLTVDNATPIVAGLIACVEIARRLAWSDDWVEA
jgi:O-antigen ligase